jgi:hypothetical protein
MLSQQRCLNHDLREAVARCPECTQFFCRECITEHDDRILCAGCLRRSAERKTARGISRAPLWRVGQVALGLVLAWLFFFICGQLLISIPSPSHEKALWPHEIDSP